MDHSYTLGLLGTTGIVKDQLGNMTIICRLGIFFRSKQWRNMFFQRVHVIQVELVMAIVINEMENANVEEMLEVFYVTGQRLVDRIVQQYNSGNMCCPLSADRIARLRVE